MAKVPKKKEKRKDVKIVGVRAQVGSQSQEKEK
jgi:hypothetical protein